MIGDFAAREPGAAGGEGYLTHYLGLLEKIFKQEIIISNI